MRGRRLRGVRGQDKNGRLSVVAPAALLEARTKHTIGEEWPGQLNTLVCIYIYIIVDTLLRT